MTASIPALLQPLKDRLAAATPGPWEWDDKVRRGLWRQRESTPVLGCSALLHPGKSDAIFIAHAPTDQAKLIAAVEAVESLAAAWQARGEHLLKAASAREFPDGVAESLSESGADFVHNAKLVRAALTQALGGDTA